MPNEQDMTSIRLHKETYNELNELKQNEETLLDVLNNLLDSHDGDIVKQKDIEVVALPVPVETSAEVKKYVGRNTTANDVISEMIETYDD